MRFPLHETKGVRRAVIKKTGDDCPDTVIDAPASGGHRLNVLATSCLLLALIVGGNLMGYAQTSREEKSASAPSQEPEAQSPEFSPGSVRLKSLPRNLFLDQKSFWSTPFHMNEREWEWTVPLGFAGAALLASDTAIEKHVPTSPTTVSHAVTASNAGLAAFASVGAGMFLWGHLSDDDDRRETGLLSGEAGIDAFLDTEVFKYAFGRDRPFVGNGRGRFFQGGDSFPSQHAAISWAIASVIAHEYPGPMTQLLAYGLAGGVSAARFAGQKHFAADLVAGSALGWYTGRQVFRSHSHYSEAEIAKWGTFSKGEAAETVRQPRYMGSPYVPLDSWVYPALDRLAALGYIHDGFADMRPWTRLECARQIKEASDRIDEDEAQDSEAARLNRDLQKEFGHEVSLLGGGDNAELRLESAYSRSTQIVGKPLTDGDHFAQTIVNDYGRTEEQGFNNVSGLSGWAAVGPLAVYVRGEYQHSPSAPALPLTATEAISRADFGAEFPPPYPVPPDTPTSAFNQGRFLDTYVALNLSDWQLSYGNQSLWWGPSQGGPMMFSDNARPIRMFRVNRVRPFTLPSFLGLLGPMRLEGFVGQYSGYQFMLTPSGLVGQYGQSLSPQPIVHGERISFKPTSNLEIGFSRTTDYGGPGYPLTLHSFLRSAFSTGLQAPGAPDKTGSHRSGLDFSYRIPGLRNGMTFYAEGLTEHDIASPVLGPDVAAWLAGIYIPRLPKFPKLDFRAEGGYTNPVISKPVIAFGGFYWDGTWITGFQNAGHLMGSWIGRQGEGEQAWTTYWFTPRSKLQLGFRHQTVSHAFIPNGGTLADADIRAECWVRSDFSLSASVQYEEWNFPVIASTRQSNVTTSVQLSFWPKGLSRKAPDK